MKLVSIILFTLLIFLVTFVTHAQDGDESIIVEVKYWSPQGDTTSGKAIYVNQYNYQLGFTVCDSAGKPMNYYTPKDLGGFVYVTGDEKIEFNSLDNPVDMGRLFLRVVYRGRFVLYQFLEVNYSAATLTFQTSYYLWNGKWLDPPITQKFEKEALLYHFSDCPELEYKIKTGEYGLSKIRNIITEFEGCQLTDTYEFFYE